MSQQSVRAIAPGRVNLIGDHTDYMGGLVLPMAVQMATTVEADRGGNRISLRSSDVADPLRLELPVGDPAVVLPEWGRYVAGVALELGASTGLDGSVSSSVPMGSGLSSSAALEVAVALALGADPEPLALAELCQRAEHSATGVPCGIMDQLAICAGIEGHALLIDCSRNEWLPIAIPAEAQFWVVHSGQRRGLVDSAYASRRDECERAAVMVGPLPEADMDAIAAIDDPVLQRRARHVRSECSRVESFARALTEGQLEDAGQMMLRSHVSLRDDFEVSTDPLDELVDDLRGRTGVLGVRLTGAGFGGCVVALARPGTELPGWMVEPSAGAHLQ